MPLSPEERAEVSALEWEIKVRRARRDSSTFVDGFFGYTSAPFQQAWHLEWNKPGARVVQWVAIEHGKTQQVTGFALHRLGRDPVNERILWIGAAAEAAYKSTGLIKSAIEKPTPFLRSVFPGLRPGRKKWTQATFSVDGAKETEKDYSVQTAGVGKQILGGRYTTVILDDVLNFDTTYTGQQRTKMVKWFFSQIPGRLLEGGIIILLGNAWYPDDLMHEAAERGYHVIRQAAYSEAEDGQIIPESILWPAQWSADRLTKKREELGSIESLRQLGCTPYSAGQGRFQMEWFERAMEAGRGLTFVHEYHGPDPVFLGVDVGISEKEGKDPWGFFAIAVDPKTKRRRLLNAIEERMDGPGGLAMLKDWNQRYAPTTLVENNAAQEFIRQFAGADGIPTRAFTTGKNKADPSFGVPSLGVELEQGMWILPCGDDQSQRMAIKWRTQCLAFAPGQHTGDLLMASWFARESARKSDGGQEVAVVSTNPQLEGNGPGADPLFRPSGGSLFDRGKR
jgi:hypothetical protein